VEQGIAAFAQGFAAEDIAGFGIALTLRVIQAHGLGGRRIASSSAMKCARDAGRAAISTDSRFNASWGQLWARIPGSDCRGRGLARFRAWRKNTTILVSHETAFLVF
jgi:hypothetical protein